MRKQKFRYTFCIVNYNEHELTNAAIKSILKNVSIDYESFIVVDNSDNGTKFKSDVNGITVIDNTEEEFCNLYKNGIYPTKEFPKTLRRCYYADQYHSCTIEKIFKICTTDFLVFFDCDILLKRDLDFLEKDDYITACELQFLRGIGERPFIRCLPVLQVFNVKDMKDKGIQCYDGFYSGESLFFQIMEHDGKIFKIKISDYCEHLWSGTWGRTREEIDAFLKKNKKLFI